MLVSVTDLVKTFGDGAAQVHAVTGVSFDIEKGEFAAVCGPSGSGKTTLLTLIAGLGRPTEGTVVVDEISLYESLSDEGLADFRSEYIGFVFQSFQLVPYLSAIENVMLPLSPKRIPNTEKRARATEALALVGIADKAGTLPGQLSGGQSQRVAIARAIVNDPPIILADEPTGNLDTATRDEIIGLFSLLLDNGHTVLMVTHDPENIQLAGKVIRIRDGTLEQ